MSVYKLEDLARRAGVSPRTVRYYVQRGLVPAPAFRGPDTAYGEEQLAALLAVKRLQEEFWPLEAIAAAIAGRSTSELHRIGDGKLVPRKPGGEPEPGPKKRGGTAREAGHEAKHDSKRDSKREHDTKPDAPEIARVRGERVELGQGLSLWIEATAGEAEQALAEEIIRLARDAQRASRKPEEGGR